MDSLGSITGEFVDFTMNTASVIDGMGFMGIDLCTQDDAVTGGGDSCLSVLVGSVVLGTGTASESVLARGVSLLHNEFSSNFLTITSISFFKDCLSLDVSFGVMGESLTVVLGCVVFTKGETVWLVLGSTIRDTLGIDVLGGGVL